jgi:hypothetical protein
LITNSPGCKWGKLFYRDLERDKISALKFSHGNFDASMKLSQRAVLNIEWWLSDDILIPVDIKKSTISMSIYSDASLKGWGGVCDSSKNWWFIAS